MLSECWWKNIVVYQIYPRSFQDSNGDGIGDLKGIISRLDYLEKLGINAIWLSPVCKSPQEDNGYDISDYEDIDAMFGTLEDMENLIKEADKHNIKIIMDLVLNHSSDEHKWFIEAKKSRDNPYHDYYVWRDGTPDNPPNDMKSIFGGSAWTYVPELKQYYFHQFAVKQPDLNWDNPLLRQEIYNMINNWIDKGVGGFRLDVIDQIAKEPDNFITNNGPMLHTYIRELSKNTFRGKNLITVGEAWGANIDRAKLYSNPDGSEFSMVFQFEHIGLDQQEGKEKWDLYPLDFIKLKEVFSKWQTELHNVGWNSLFWNNHDLPRIVSRWGNDKEYRVESAKMLATVLYGMEGTPYIFQGEEIGMTNASYFDFGDYKDIESINMYNERLKNGYSKEEILKSLHCKSRDNARTPMQWDSTENSGFTTGKPWLSVNKNYKEINAKQAVEDENSIFHYYRKLIAFRKENPIITKGDYTLLYPKHNEVFAYKRTYDGKVLYVICNFYGSNVQIDLPNELADKQPVITNYKNSNYSVNELKPYEARMYLLD